METGLLGIYRMRFIGKAFTAGAAGALAVVFLSGVDVTPAAAQTLEGSSWIGGITNTSIIADFRRGVGDDIIDHAEAVAGRMARPQEMAPAMLFLADEASSSYLNGVNLNIDRGTAAARASGQSNPEAIWGSRA